MSPATNDNVIEDNEVTGNTNGIIIVAGAEGNVIRRNTVVANPPVQVSITFPTANGVDIRNGAAIDTNTIVDNLCLTAVNAACPDADPRGNGTKEKKEKKEKKDK